jgi:hypothetical protein
MQRCPRVCCAWPYVDFVDFSVGPHALLLYDPMAGKINEEFLWFSSFWHLSKESYTILWSKKRLDQPGV